MAFNPFSNFRKYQKFWMATILIVCMVTFVLCTGVGGDLSDRILNMVRGRSGNHLATVDGRKVYYQEMSDRKDRRTLVDKFMRKACDLLLEKLGEMTMKIEKTAADLDKKVKDPSLGEEEKNKKTAELQVYLFRLMASESMIQDLWARLARKHYFESGTTLENLAEFLMWRNEADRLGIHLVDKVVKEMFDDEVFVRFSDIFTDNDLQKIFREVSGGFRSLTWATVMDALRDEFRVRLAKLAIATAQVASFRNRTYPGDKNIHRALETLKFTERMRDFDRPLSLRLINVRPTPRAGLTPHELWEYFQKKRAEYEVALVPVAAKDFLPALDFVTALVPPPPSALEEFFEKRKDKVYDPTSPQNGLQSPHKVKIRYIMGDVKDSYYQGPAQALVHLQANFGGQDKVGEVQPIPNLGNPFGSWMGLVAHLGSANLALDASLDRDYDHMKKRHLSLDRRATREEIETAEAFLQKYLSAKLSDDNFVWTLYKRHGKPTAAGVAALLGHLPMPGPAVGGPVTTYHSYNIRHGGRNLALAAVGGSVTVFDSYRLGGLEKDFAPLLQEERRQRALMAGRLVQMGGAIATVGGFPSLRAPFLPPMVFEAWKKIDADPRLTELRFFPLAQVKEDLLSKMIDRLALNGGYPIEERKAKGWMQQNMIAMRQEVEKLEKDGNFKEFKDEPARLAKKYGLVIDGTYEFYDQYHIHQAPELAPLREAYPKHFWKLNMAEGREATALKEDQFHRLFFDNEKFAAGVGSYLVKPWPPDVTVKISQTPRDEDRARGKMWQRFRDLRKDPDAAKKPIKFFDSDDKPILFWKTEELPQEFPAKMEGEVKDRVLATWKLELARDTVALDWAKKLTLTMQNTAQKNLADLALTEAAALGHSPIRFYRPTEQDPKTHPVAHLLQSPVGPQSMVYREFSLPKDVFDFPQADMAKQLLILIDDQQAVETGTKALDELNKHLFKENKRLGKQIQILTNKPRSVYYVAVVVRPHSPTLDDFHNSYKFAAGEIERAYDDFIARAHTDLGKKYLDELTAQLLILRKVAIVASAEDKKHFQER